MRDAIPYRIGAIAADLARIASIVEDPADEPAVFDLIRESKWFIEWAAPSLELNTAVRLVEIQVALASIENRFRDGYLAPDLLAKATAEWSDEVLAMSGLLE